MLWMIRNVTDDKKCVVRMIRNERYGFSGMGEKVKGLTWKRIKV